ncbi:hypothetical protein A3Q56_04052 [Intoshia linei]|uniref:Uncharacterized protein n=1 Tax=Intoshia linei TaxID=1819745 RepID=A0A177B3L5_9BILA|nr:hypothetical protein A3Q56_04052 [Intoshia linei]
MLERFCECINEVELFLDKKDLLDKFIHTNDDTWKVKLYFITDMAIFFNDLNKHLQGHGIMIDLMFSSVKGFVQKLNLIKRKIENSENSMFTFLKQHTCHIDNTLQQEFLSFITWTIETFSQRFIDFSDISKLFKVVRVPHLLENFDNYECFNWDWVCSNLDSELIDLKNNMRRVQKSAKRDVNVLEKYARQLQRPKKSGFVTFDVFWVNVKLRADLFYNGLNNTKVRNRLSVKSSQAQICLKTSNYRPDIEKLTSNFKQHHPSH